MAQDIPRWSIAIAVALLSAACHSSQAPRAEDQFAPGKWRIEGWMEAGGASTRGRDGEIKPQIVDLTPEQAAQHPAAVLFSYFYHGVPRDADISMQDGKLDGTFHQPRVDDIAAQDVKISGTYDHQHFRIKFGYRAFGINFDQIVEGELIGPLND